MPTTTQSEINDAAKAGWRVSTEFGPRGPDGSDVIHYVPIAPNGATGDAEFYATADEAWHACATLHLLMTLIGTQAVASPSPAAAPEPASSSTYEQELEAAMEAWNRWDGTGTFDNYPSEKSKPAPTTGLICPHCGARGSVHTSAVRIKAGVAGEKLTGALLTAGLSLLIPGIGLSRKINVTACQCSKCGSRWTVS
jgi:hypothetical protein